MTPQPLIRAMGESDPEVISAAFTAIGWDTKPPALYRHYLGQQEEGRLLAWMAEWQGEFAGYVTLLWTSAYGPFAERQIPEVSDLNVLPKHRRQGVGNAQRGYLPDGRGIMYRNQPVQPGAVARIDDDAALMLTRPATRAEG